MDKILLRQALKFKDNNPTNTQISKLRTLALKYQKENAIYFLSVKHGQRSKIIDENLFFSFLSEANNLSINSFEDIENLLDKATTRQESIEKTGNSKEYFAQVFDKVVLFQKSSEHPILYKNINEIPILEDKQILAVENGETFLNIERIMSKFGFEQFVYISGFPNKLTKDFLKDKEVVFFVDYDIWGIKIYDSFTCKKKRMFRHPDINKYFENSFEYKKTLSKKLYLKQRKNLPESHQELQWLIDLIKKHSGVVEQECIV